MLKVGLGRAKPRTFEFIPRFYDPAQEELENKIKKYEQGSSEESDIENVRSRIKANLRIKHYGNTSVRSSQLAKSNFRLIVIIMILGMTTYLLMSSNKVIGLLEAFTK